MWHLMILSALCFIVFSQGEVLSWKPKLHTSFLKSKYNVLSDKSKNFVIRQVPGDGGCLFHSIAAWLSFVKTNNHVDFDEKLEYLSIRLRELAVKSLKKSNLMLQVDDAEYICSRDLLTKVSEYHNLSMSQYCNAMLHPNTWGGGPEIIALSNHFRCPIDVYEQAHQRGSESKVEFCVNKKMSFSRPDFNHKPCLSILSADGRFPDIQPGEELPLGNHFLAMFPCDSEGKLTTSSQNYTSMNIDSCPYSDELFRPPSIFERSRRFMRRISFSHRPLTFQSS